MVPAPAAPANTARFDRHALGSLAAENLWWLGRYLERAEASARMFSIVADVVSEEIPRAERRQWLPLWHGLLEATGHADERIAADRLRRIALDGGHSSSIYSSVRAACDNARRRRGLPINAKDNLWWGMTETCGRMGDPGDRTQASGIEVRRRERRRADPSRPPFPILYFGVAGGAAAPPANGGWLLRSTARSTRAKSSTLYGFATMPRKP